MENKLVSLILASTLVLGNGCSRQPTDSYTTEKDNEIITLNDYRHIVGGQSYRMITKKPNGDKITLYADKETWGGYKLVYAEIKETNTISVYDSQSEIGAKVLKAMESKFQRDLEFIQQRRLTNILDRVQSVQTNSGTTLVEQILR